MARFLKELHKYQDARAHTHIPTHTFTYTHTHAPTYTHKHTQHKYIQYNHIHVQYTEIHTDIIGAHNKNELMYTFTR